MKSLAMIWLSSLIAIPAMSQIKADLNPTDEPSGLVPEGYRLDWNDEFNDGPELNAIDWTHEVQNAGWVNHELQNYVNRQTPQGALVTEVKNGRLIIRCLKENGKIYSGRVYAHVKTGWKYGYIEARIKWRDRHHGGGGLPSQLCLIESSCQCPRTQQRYTGDT